MARYIVVLDLETIQTEIPPAYLEAVKAGDVYVSNSKDSEAYLVKNWWKQAEGSMPIVAACATINLDKGCAENVQGVQTQEFSGAHVVAFLEEYLREFKPDKVVTYGGKNFDFPILAYQFGLHRKTWDPLFNSARYGYHCDLIEHMPPWFNIFRPLKGKPHSACSLFGIPHSGTSGGDVKEMWTEDCKTGDLRVLDYCFEDVEAIAKLYCKLSRFYLRD